MSLPSTQPATKAERTVRLGVSVRGAVQGVGFRPFVYRLATELNLTGWVQNSPDGVRLEVEGVQGSVDEFLRRLETESPALSSMETVEIARIDVGRGCIRGFDIRATRLEGARTTLILPDVATCGDCVREIFDATNRRFRHPFTNCTQCGPRFSLIEALPYDRSNTSMRGFAMCPRCQAEYGNPLDRRFHAQPNACPECGPQLELWDRRGGGIESRDAALRAAAAAIRQGRIVAVKGLGGFHLLVAAHDEAAVLRLRARKHRQAKPFALLFPALDSVREYCEVSPLEERLLSSKEAPIVLLRRRTDGLLRAVAPGNSCLGAMLPYTGLHHLLAAELGFPVVATSGNRCDEPICTDEHEALDRLAGIADCFLVHNRPIVRAVDDSIVRVVAGRELVLRRARGFAPLPITIPERYRNTSSAAVLAVGGHLKNTVALAFGRRVFLSQHLGDLENAVALTAFHAASSDLPRLYDAVPRVIAADAHPDYLSTQFARERVARTPGARLVRVQHHHAHVLACMAENGLEPPVLGVCWDGTGYGPDGTIWGGEFLRVTAGGFQRVAHLRSFPLPGGDRATREPRRAALGMLCGILGEDAFARAGLPTLAAYSEAELRGLRQMLQRRVNTPLTSSVGRVFDAVASLVGLRQVSTFEGQAAMELESIADASSADGAYEVSLCDGVIDWTPLILGVLRDVDDRLSTGAIAARFHCALVECLIAVARAAGEKRVALTGGCFQNKILTERAVQRLREEGFLPCWHRRVPPNDGGLALGQVLAASLAPAPEESPCA